MSEIEEVQKQMKDDMEAMKEQITTMMEAMISMRKMMEVYTATVVPASTTIEVGPTHPSSLNQVNHPTSDMVGQGGKALGRWVCMENLIVSYFMGQCTLQSTTLGLMGSNVRKTN